MKFLLPALAAVLVFASCQKKVTETRPESLEAETSSQAAVPNIPCVSINFVSDHIIKPGEVPPFRYTKQLYPDGRVKSINMLSRVYPIYAGYKKHALEINGTFTYSTDNAFFKGTGQVWEYYKTSTGAGARRSISKKNINWRFYFNNVGLCIRIGDVDRAGDPEAGEEEYALLYYTYGGERGDEPSYVSFRKSELTAAEEEYRTIQVKIDQYDNVIDFDFPFGGADKNHVTYAYDYTIPRGSKQYSYIPSQNLISPLYNFLEVMQWVRQPTHQRKAVAGVFYLPNGTRITQSQVYKNYQFSAKGNQMSLTYGDNVPQRTSWYCK